MPEAKALYELLTLLGDRGGLPAIVGVAGILAYIRLHREWREAEAQKHKDAQDERREYRTLLQGYLKQHSEALDRLGVALSDLRDTTSQEHAQIMRDVWATRGNGRPQ